MLVCCRSNTNISLLTCAHTLMQYILSSTDTIDASDSLKPKCNACLFLSFTASKLDLTSKIRWTLSYIQAVLCTF